MPVYYVGGKTYQVATERPNAPGAQDKPDWYEYQVYLYRSADRALIAEWDSFDECFNGKDRLTCEEAEMGRRTVVEDVAEGRADDWFTIPPGAERLLPGLNKQEQPDILLEPLTVADAIHALFSIAYANACEEYAEETGDQSLLSPPPGTILPEWAPHQTHALLPMAWYLIGRVQQDWDCSVGLVFHHGGITSLADQTQALTDLFLGLQGHGVCLDDDFSSHIERAEKVLKKSFDAAPFQDEMEWLSRLAESALSKARRQKRRLSLSGKGVSAG